MNASHVLLITVDQSKSRLSSCTISSFSNAFVMGAAVTDAARAICSPSMKRGPKSGKFRLGSNGFHLGNDIEINFGYEVRKEENTPEIVEVI